MNKIAYYRKKIYEQYANSELPGAAATGEALIAEYKSCLANESAAFADDLFNLARVYDDMGFTERAVMLYVESANRVLGNTGESPAFALRLNNLAAVLSRQGNAEAAYRMYGHAAAIARGNYKDKSPELADAVYNLANAAADIGNRDEAIRLHSEALGIRQTAPSEDIVHSMHSLAFLYEENKDYAKAVQYAAAAMDRASRAGKDTYFGACYYLAELYSADEKHSQSRPLYESVLRWIEETEGRDHSAFITVATRLAYSLANLGAFKEALALMYSIHESLRGKTGGDYICHAGCLRNLAILHKQLNEPLKAEEMMLKSLKIKKRVLGNHTREYIQDALFLIELYTDSDRLDKALEMLVFLLMHQNDADKAEPVKELIRIFTKAGGTRLQALLAELEKLNNPEILQVIMDDWDIWEAEEDQ